MPWIFTNTASCGVLKRDSPCAFCPSSLVRKNARERGLCELQNVLQTFFVFQLLWKVLLRELYTAVIWWQWNIILILFVSFDRTFSRMFFLCKLQQNVLKNVLPCVNLYLFFFVLFKTHVCLWPFDAYHSFCCKALPWHIDYSPCAYVSNVWCARVPNKEAFVSFRTFFKTFSVFQLFWKVHSVICRTAVMWWHLGCHPYLVVASAERSQERSSCANLDLIMPCYVLVFIEAEF